MYLQGLFWDAMPVKCQKRENDNVLLLECLEDSQKIILRLPFHPTLDK